MEEEKRLKQIEEKNILKEGEENHQNMPKEVEDEKRLNSNTSFSLKCEKKEVEEGKALNVMDSRFRGNDNRRRKQAGRNDTQGGNDKWGRNDLMNVNNKRGGNDNLGGNDKLGSSFSRNNKCSGNDIFNTSLTLG